MHRSVDRPGIKGREYLIEAKNRKNIDKEFILQSVKSHLKRIQTVKVLALITHCIFYHFHNSCHDFES